MIAVFNTFFINSLNMTFLVILLALLEPLLKRYLSAVCIYCLWVILLIGLLLPIRFDTNKAFLYIGLPQTSVEEKVELDIKPRADFYNLDGIEKNDLLQKQQSHEASNSRPGIWDYVTEEIIVSNIHHIVNNRYLVLSVVWSLVAMFLLLIKGIEYFIDRRRLKRFMKPLDHDNVIQVYNHCILELECIHRKEALGSDKIKIYQCPIISCPMSIGILKPIILLPNETYSDKEIYFILKHELIHILRRDSLVKLLRLFVVSIHWFNPLCYLLATHLEEWCEVSCDEKVLLNSTRSDCFSYGKLLLKYTDIKKQTVIIKNMIGGNNMKKRLQFIIENRKKSSGIVPIVLLLCIVFTTVIVSAKSQADVLASEDIIAASDETLVQSEEGKYNSEDSEEKFLRNSSRSTEVESPEKDTLFTDSNSRDTSTSTEVSGDQIAEYAIQAEGTPYLWGGDNLSAGVDSSGFTKVIYKKFGYELPRTSKEQADTCKKVPMDGLQAGDLIFYGIDKDQINHVGIYIGEDKVIHAKNAKDGVIIQDINYRTPLAAGRVIY